MANSILQGGIRELQEIREQVVELNDCRQRKQELDTQEKEAQANISKKEKLIADNIKKTTKQRREDLETTFDHQLKNVKEKLKSVESDKEKKKKKAMMERVDSETAGFRNADEELLMAGKSVFKEENIPLIYNNRLFFSLYFPRGLDDILIIVLTLAVAFLVVPLGIYTLLFDGARTSYLVISYLIAILVFGGLYLFVGKTKFKYQEALNRVREMRRRIEASRKQQKKIKRKIVTDKDESQYDLGEFDQAIAEYNKTIDELLEKKKAALLEFDEVTAKEITRQITGENEEGLNSLKEEYREVYSEGQENMEKLNDLSVKISTKYESVLGKEVLTVENLDAMSKSINAGEAETIGEARQLIAKQN